MGVLVQKVRSACALFRGLFPAALALESAAVPKILPPKSPPLL